MHARFALFTLFVALLVSLNGCNSNKNRKTQGPLDTSTDATDQKFFSNFTTKKKTEKRIAALSSKKYLSPAEEAELKVLKNGGSEREANLAAKKYTSGLSDQEADELKFLENGQSPREAELRAKKENGTLNPFEQEELDKIEHGSKIPTQNTDKDSPSALPEH